MHLKTMPEAEQLALLKNAVAGSIAEVCDKVRAIAEDEEIDALRELIAQYDEIMDEYNKAHDAQLEAEWLAEYEEDTP